MPLLKFTAFINKEPAITKASLFANKIRLPDTTAEKVGSRAAAPTIAERTYLHFDGLATNEYLSFPKSIFVLFL